MRAILALALSMLAGCAGHETTMILLPSESGGPTGAVVVIDPTGKGEIVIDQANEQARARGGTVVRSALSPRQIDQRVGAMLQAVPKAPSLYSLYFTADTGDLDLASLAVLPALFAEIARRPGADVEIVGHTDTVGDDAYNDALSLRRADELARVLIAKGLDPDIIRTIGRGERDPRVLTGDNVAMSANRRIEVIVR